MEPARPKQFILNINKYFETLQGMCGVSCAYMIQKHSKSPLPLNDHLVLNHPVGRTLSKDFSYLHSPKYILDSVMCYAELKGIIAGTIA